MEEIEVEEIKIEAERVARMAMLSDVIAAAKREVNIALIETKTKYEKQIRELYRIDQDIIRRKKERARRR